MKCSLLWLLMVLPALALAAPEVRVRTALLNADNTVVGATVTLQVDLLVDTWFSAPPELPKLTLDGAVVSSPSSEAVHLTEKQDGKSFFGLRFNYQITAQSAQAYDIPPLSIRVTPGQSDAPITVTSAAQHFSAVQPFGAENDESLLVAQQVEMSQTVEPSHDPLRVGDSVTRTVSIRALGAQAMLIPAPSFADVEGLSRDVQAPVVHPLSDGRGGVSGGAREDAAIYRVTHEGRFQLPAIEVSWWSVAGAQARSASVPEVTLQAKGSADYSSGFSMAEDLRALRHSAQVHVARHWLVLLALAIFTGAAVYFGRPWLLALRRQLLRQRAQRKQQWLASEDFAWRLAGHQAAARPLQLDALYLWVRRCSGRLDLHGFLGTTDTPRAQRLQRCLAALYGRPHAAEAASSGLATVFQDVQQVRRDHPSLPASRYCLKPLNPGSALPTFDERPHHGSSQ